MSINAYEDGAKAYRDGVHFRACPHSARTDAARWYRAQWCSGWLDAQTTDPEYWAEKEYRGAR